MEVPPAWYTSSGASCSPQSESPAESAASPSPTGPRHVRACIRLSGWRPPASLPQAGLSAPRTGGRRDCRRAGSRGLAPAVARAEAGQEQRSQPDRPGGVLEHEAQDAEDDREHPEGAAGDTERAGEERHEHDDPYSDQHGDERIVVLPAEAIL